MGAAHSVLAVLNERLMVILSAATLPGTALQLLSNPSALEASAIETFDGAVVLLFGVEYAAGMLAAANRSAFVRNRWNLFNLFILLLALAGAATASPLLYSAPSLRIVRAARLITESGRSSVKLGVC